MESWVKQKEMLLNPSFCCNLSEKCIFIRPRVAGADLQTASLLTRSLAELLFSSKAPGVNERCCIKVNERWPLYGIFHWPLYSLFIDPKSKSMQSCEASRWRVWYQRGYPVNFFWIYSALNQFWVGKSHFSLYNKAEQGQGSHSGLKTLWGVGDGGGEGKQSLKSSGP